MKSAQAVNIKPNSGNRAGFLVPGAFSLALLLCLPIFVLFLLAFDGDLESFTHIARTVLPSAGATTVLLMLGVGLFTAILGTSTAWLVTFHDFPLRNTVQWALMLPLAVPTYISAYAFVEFFSFTGPLQETVRLLGGYKSTREYWFPEIRSIPGAIFILSIVLYPYVYLSVKTLFALQGANIHDIARSLGASKFKVLRSVTIPLARPAIILGVTLALMETVNDIGAVEYLGVQTLTFSVFSVWLNQSDLAGASQIALFLLIIIFALIYVEKKMRGSRRYHEPRAGVRQETNTIRLHGAKALVAALVCLSPIIIGIGVPIYVLAGFAAQDFGQLWSPSIIKAFVTTFTLGLVAAILAVLGGLVLSYLLRIRKHKSATLAVRLATLGYAVPGTLIAIGVFIPFAYFDNALDGFLRQSFGVSTGLLLTGSGAALVFAYVVRFMAMSEGSLENGFSKLSPNLDAVARTMGRGNGKILSQILLPLMLPAITGAALLVFVDVVKELSATILLRPFGMNTLATHVYDFASQGRVEDGALACLLIICVGILPVIFLSRRTN
ncbi:MAG: iron ABC transporter permease [Rhizobiaceae bacterium]|nr:iron ABC transporter permease [Rhizobiaceae bacterium]